MDRAWWKTYSAEAQKTFNGQRITCNQHINGVTTVHFNHPKNSGAGAMVLAESMGARRIILLGFDCQYSPDGTRHWHGDHPKGLGNAVSMPKWYPHFHEVAGLLGHCEIINSTRATALDFWQKKPLEQALDNKNNPRRSANRAGRHGAASSAAHRQAV